MSAASATTEKNLFSVVAFPVRAAAKKVNRDLEIKKGLNFDF